MVCSIFSISIEEDLKEEVFEYASFINKSGPHAKDLLLPIAEWIEVTKQNVSQETFRYVPSDADLEQITQAMNKAIR